MGFSRDSFNTTKMIGIILKTKSESVKFDKMNEINSTISFPTYNLDDNAFVLIVVEKYNSPRLFVNTNVNPIGIFGVSTKEKNQSNKGFQRY